MRTFIKYAITILLLSTTLNAHCQESQDTILRNHPRFMVDGVRWFDCNHDIFMDSVGISDENNKSERRFLINQYRINGDTIVNSKEYKKAYMKLFQYHSEMETGIEVFEVKHPFFLFREDSLGNQYVGWWMYDGFKEQFVINYGKPWALGDTLTYSTATRGIQKEVISRVEERVLLDGKVYLIANSFIFGVGHILDGPFSCFQREDGARGVEHLLEYYHGDTLVYENTQLKKYIQQIVALYDLDMSEYEGDPIFTDIQSVKKDDKSLPGPYADCIFDLQGRQLRHKPEKGLYIQNGKKILAR